MVAERAKSAHEAWKILQKAYEGRGLSRRLGLLRSLFSTKLSENSSMEVYLNKIKEISHQLHETESPLDDEFVAVIMLSGLTDDYDPLIMAIEHSTSKLSTEIISQKLLQETQRREEKSEETALITQKQPKCYGCGAKGHMIRNCPKKKGPAKVQNQENDPPTQRNPNEQRVSTYTINDSESEDLSDETENCSDETYIPGEDSMAEAEQSDTSYEAAPESPLQANFVGPVDSNPDLKFYCELSCELRPPGFKDLGLKNFHGVIIYVYIWGGFCQGVNLTNEPIER
ncbi:hypothetical protein SFRURICE_008144 [Spodoptera frugiperda]|nr:hypothetical protein SFRURICE_008144 [Spodoptera frugiperda]